MGKTRTIRVSEQTYAEVERRAQAEHRSVSNMAECILRDRLVDRVVYVAPELSDVESWGPWDRASHETDEEYEARSALLNRIASMPDTAPKK